MEQAFDIKQLNGWHVGLNDELYPKVRFRDSLKVLHVGIILNNHIFCQCCNIWFELDTKVLDRLIKYPNE